MAYVEDRDGGRCGAAIRSGEHTYIVIGKVEQRFEALRVAGRDAADLEHPMTFNDAGKLNEVIRRDWGLRYQNVETCDCHACRERRDRDAEMRELARQAQQPKREFGILLSGIVRAIKKLRGAR